MPPGQRTNWETPSWIFNQLWDEFGGFDGDPCCEPMHHTAIRILMESDDGWIAVLPEHAVPGNAETVLVDGLVQPWHGKVFINPPYPAGEWVAKARSEVERSNGATLVVALLKATTDVRWWHEHVEGIAEVRFIKGRLRFGDGRTPAPFPSCIVIWRRKA